MASHYSTIDHALGAPGERYFGDGHRRSTYSFTTKTLVRGLVTGISTVTQDGSWSSKEAGVVSRHLSTIDAVSLAGLALEVVLQQEPVELESLMVTSASVRAGSASTDDLVAVPVEARVDWLPEDRAFACSVVVGTMKVSLTVVPVAAETPLRAEGPSPAFFAGHLRSRVQHITDIDIDLEAGVMRARLGALAASSGVADGFRGLQSAHSKVFSVCEAIVCLAQLAQAIAYEYDHMSRDQSAVFWLRRFDINLVRPWIKVGQLVDVRVEILKADEVVVRGAVWRTLRLAAAGQGIDAIADVAHILPDAASEAL
ncbi:AvrD family protein [Sanguibacter sp. Leaf3]|uniref:AvrD family protein n=1 Tax=Sanguibacter sp. Leaf3 TaxID=1736209 RepID=UPI0006F697E8|nr:AvrD family protein [Sanguibacter sp. Leaf3]KQT95971.1 hypothetical protein ASG53_19065 [Sanguibacter sp. Leaf3]